MNRIKFEKIAAVCLYSALATLLVLANSPRRETISKMDVKMDKSQEDINGLAALSAHVNGSSTSSTQLNRVDRLRLEARDVRGQQGKSRPRKRHFRVATIEVPPFMMRRKPANGQDKRQQDGGDDKDDKSRGGTSATQVDSVWYGYCMDFFLELIKQLPFEVSYEIYEVPDGKFGSKIRQVLQEDSLANASASGAAAGQAGPVRKLKEVEQWSGLIGELQRGRAELVLAPLAVMAERETVVDFTMPFYDLVGIQILLKRPEVPKNWFKFLTVLDNDVWLSIGLAYFVTSFMIYIFDRLSPYSHKNLTRIERMRQKRAAPLQTGQQHSSGWNKIGHLGPNRVAPDSKFYLSRPLMSALAAQAPPVSTISGKPYVSNSSPALPGRDLKSANDINNSNNNNNRDSSVDAFKRRRASQSYLDTLRLTFGTSLGHHTNSSGGHFGGDQNANDGDDEGEEEEEDGGEASADGKPDFNFRDSLWFCITSLTPQGGGEAPQNLSGRVVAGAWWLFCFIVIASYTANLAAFLTVSRLDIPIESLDDLAKQYRIKYAPIDGTAERAYFERMAHIEEIFYNIWKNMSLSDNLSEAERAKFAVWDYPISDKYTKIWSQIQEVQMPASLTEALERVRASTLDDGFALLANANLVKYAVMTDCSLKAVGDEFSRKPMALAVQKGQDELREELSYAILRLINRRYMEVLREKWWTNNPARVMCDSNDESEGISIENIGGVFIIILAGILLSFLVWAIERFVYTSKIGVSRDLLPGIVKSVDTARRMSQMHPG